MENCNSKKSISTEDIWEIQPYGESPDPGTEVRRGWEPETDIRVITKDGCEYSVDGDVIQNLLPKKMNIKVIPVKPGYSGKPSLENF